MTRLDDGRRSDGGNLLSVAAAARAERGHLGREDQFSTGARGLQKLMDSAFCSVGSPHQQRRDGVTGLGHAHASTPSLNRVVQDVPRDSHC